MGMPLVATLSLAARNLLRNRRRSITTMLALVVGAVAMLLFGGYSRTIQYGLQTGYVQGAGHLQLQRDAVTQRIAPLWRAAGLATVLPADMPLLT